MCLSTEEMAGPNNCLFLFILIGMALHRGRTQFSPPSVHKDAWYSHFQQQGMLLNFLFFACLKGRKQYLIVALIFISLIIKDSEYLFISSRTT